MARMARSTRKQADLPEFEYDIIVIGGGVAGVKAAVTASKEGARVALIEAKRPCKNNHAALTKALFEMARVHARSGISDQVPTIPQLLQSIDRTAEADACQAMALLKRHRVDVITGWATFVDQYTVLVDGHRRIIAKTFFLATGSKPFRPSGVDFGDNTGPIFDSDGLYSLESQPRSVAIIGGGIIGSEWASAFAVTGAHVTVLDRQPQPLSICEGDVAADARHYFRRYLGIEFRLEANVIGCTVKKRRGKSDVVQVELADGSVITADIVLYAIGRRGVVDGLNLEAAGLEPDSRGNIVAKNICGQTEVENIYAMGDALTYAEEIGVRALTLASTGKFEGRLAALHAMGKIKEMPSVLSVPPVCIFTQPEIAMVGRTTEQMRAAGIGFVTGQARYDEVAKGRIINEKHGSVTLVFEQKAPHRLVGVHIIGMRASEIIGQAQTWIQFGATVHDLADTISAHPTLSELYQEAATDALDQLNYGADE